MKKPQLALIERETLISFNEAERIAEIYTFNGKLKRQLAGLSEKGLAQLVLAEDEIGSVSYSIPKEYVCINPHAIYKGKK